MTGGQVPTIGPAALPQRASNFFDRVVEYGLITKHLALLTDDPQHLRVFGIEGMGGVGKSRFLGEVQSRLAALEEPPTLVWVPLDLPGSSPLLEIRDQLGIDCYLFDAALLTLATALQLPYEQLGAPDPRDSTAVRLLHSGDELGHLAVPRSSAGRVYEAIPRGDVMRLGYDREAFDRVDALRDDPVRLYDLLPWCLGTDLNRRLNAPGRRRIVFFYDAYEKQSRRVLDGGALWLQTFIRSVGAGIHLIATRQPLGWDDPVLLTKLQERVLGNLPERDCRRLIRRELGDHLPRLVEDRLVEASGGGVPFFLLTLVDICRAQIHLHGGVTVDELPRSTPGCVPRLLEHLDDTERTQAVALASVQYFDEPLFDRLVRALHLEDGARAMTTFTEWFFVVDAGGGQFRTHDLLTEAVRTSASEASIRQQALKVATAHLAARSGPTTHALPEGSPRQFTALLEGWRSLDSVPVADVEKLLDIGYAFYDIGAWRELADLPAGDRDLEPHDADLVARYFAALTTRRTEGVPQSRQLLEALAPYRDRLGRYRPSFDLELTYVREIGGNYGHAREAFRAMSERATPFDPTRRDHVRARLLHADVLTVDGRFAEASRLLVEAYEQVTRESPFEWSELMRHRGHAHRLSFDLERATLLYHEALEEMEHTPSMAGKLRTNLAETRCWSEPGKGVKDAEAAIELNTRLGSRIEVAKAQAARAIALARLDRTDEALVAAAQARDTAREAGYPAGECFALQALVVAQLRAGAPDRADTAYQQLAERVTSLSTYGHLCVVPAMLRGDQDQVNQWSSGVEWIVPPHVTVLAL
jgi:tetratricopeptide (TPR) repeat protein